MRTRAWVAALYLAPALLIMGVYLIYPMFRTIYLSLHGPNKEQFVGLANYVEIFTSENMQTTLYNNFLWLTVFVAAVVLLGLVIAVLLDRVRYEKISKAIIFMPMGIQAVGAGIVWKFVYAYAPKGEDQIGLLNAIVTSLGGDPVAWLLERSINDFMVMLPAIWIWTGFSMVFCSAAYKAQPRDVRESARIDGANEWQIFWRITVPMMRIPLITITVSMLTFALKLFDEVYVMTGGNYGTQLLAIDLYENVWKFYNDGLAAAIGVVLLLAIVPAIIYNLRVLRERGVL